MTKTSQKEIGMRIRYLRKSNRLSIEKLSLVSGVNKNYLGDLERGTRNPTLLVLEKIARGLNITLEELFKGIM